jgi:hypothetical protein
VGIIYTTYSNVKKPCTFSAVCWWVSRVFTVSSYYFSKQRYPVLGNRDTCFSWRWEQNFTVSLRWSLCFKTIIQWDASGNICEVGTNSNNTSHSTNTNTLNALYCIAMLKCIYNKYRHFVNTLTSPERTMFQIFIELIITNCYPSGQRYPIGDEIGHFSFSALFFCKIFIFYELKNNIMKTWFFLEKGRDCTAYHRKFVNYVCYLVIQKWV